jgi:broad specificity phosphatase PhoE
MRLVYFITHPDVIIDPAVPVPQWPLSPRGRERMRKLLAQPWMDSIGSVYCSTEQKAIDGAVVLAEYLKIEYEMIEELGEIDRSATGYLPKEEHAAAAEAFFAHPEVSVRGWEKAVDAQRRIVGAVERATEGDRGKGNIAIVSHGGVGTLYLCHLKGYPISWRERQPGRSGGNYYCFGARSKALLYGWQPIDG